MFHSLLYLDRYRNQGTRTYSRHAGVSEADAQYRPDSPVPSFSLPVFVLPREEMNVYTARPAPELLSRYCPEDGVLFCVHPQVLECRPEDRYVERTLRVGVPAPSFRVSPSSSTRTVYVHEASPFHALKVHFPFQVSRYTRKMRDEVVQQALRVSLEVQEGYAALGEHFAFQREVLGVTHRAQDPDTTRGEHWGYLVREVAPFPPSDSEGVLIPGFALYGADYFRPDEPPLILDIMAERDPVAFILEKVFFPIIRQWVDAFLHFGFMLEPHGQNVLLEVGEDGDVARIVHRDLNLGIDTRRRRDLGLPVERGNTYNQMEGGEFASITYDKFMGNHFFHHLVEVLVRSDPRLSSDAFREPCVALFQDIFPHHEQYMPRTVHYFTEERDEFGKPRFRDTGLPPEWRP